MYSSIDTTALKRPGDFILSEVILTSYQSEGNNSIPKKISVSTLVTELNIYESIHNKTLSGSLVLIDAQNVVAALPLTGFERLEFKLFTPSISRGFDFTEKSGHPMYIYRIGQRQGMNPRVQTYILYFASKEMLRNEQVRTSKSYSGQISNIVTDILRDTDLLDTEKDIFVEETRGIHKYVMPLERPLDAIEMLSLEARSKKYHNPGMQLYETAFGFNFKSLESMLAITDSQARPVVARFEPKPASVRINGNRDILQEMKIASEFTIKDQFNTLKNLRNGVFASLITQYNAYDKTHRDIIFDYNKEYELANHAEHDKDGGRTDNKGILPLVNVGGKLMSEYHHGVQYLRSDTSNIHNNIETSPTSEIVPRRLSSKLAFETFKLELTVPGFTGLSAGELIAFDMPSYTSVSDANPLDHDPYMSGRYLISGIRHIVSVLNGKHSMVLECLKDSVKRPYPEELNDTFTGKEKADRGVIDQYSLDETLIANELTSNNVFKA